jgi:glycosyltransferase involved in cell wall biosynthesis
MKPTISIITVCRNESLRIRETAESIIHQSFRDYEWIVKDGGSTDGTVDVLNEYRQHMAHFESGPDAGIYDAMNHAAARARGDWQLFLNGGDQFAHQDVMSEMSVYLSSFTDEILLGDHLAVCRGDDLGKRKGYTGVLDKHHFYRSTINHQSAFIPRNIFQAFGPYDTSYRVLGDYDFFVRAVLGGVFVRCVPVLVAKYDMEGISMQMKAEGKLDAERMRVRRNYSWGYRGRRIMSDIFVRAKASSRSFNRKEVSAEE